MASVAPDLAPKRDFRLYDSDESDLDLELEDITKNRKRKPLAHTADSRNTTAYDGLHDLPAGVQVEDPPSKQPDAAKSKDTAVLDERATPRSQNQQITLG
jgi:hypothetical protein